VRAAIEERSRFDFLILRDCRSCVRAIERARSNAEDGEEQRKPSNET
jgi:hypothetical protein